MPEIYQTKVQIAERVARTDNNEKRIKQNFIITYNSNTADLLAKLGFTKVENSNKNAYMFINDNTLKFDDSIDLSKIQYTNTLCI